MDALEKRYLRNLAKRESEAFGDFLRCLNALQLSLKANYDPNQPRIPAGSGRESGRWADSGKVPDSWGDKRDGKFSDHYKRHKSDFNAKSKKDYADKAQKFRMKAAKEKLPAVETSEEHGKRVKVYDPKTNSFAVYDRDGKTHTYFKPTSKTYFERETKKELEKGGRKIEHQKKPNGGRGRGTGLPADGTELWNEYIIND